MRWDPYSLTSDAEFDDFWTGRLSRPGPRLLILGKGFDVRALAVARRLHTLGADLDVWLLAFDNGLGDSARRAELTAANADELERLYGRHRIESVPIVIGGPAGAAVTPRNTWKALTQARDCRRYADVVVDISAMPRMVALTAVGALLFALDEAFRSEGRAANLHVAVAENVSADLGAARGSLRDGVSFVLGFSGKLEAQTTQNWPRVWFPVLGEGQRERLSLIRQHLNPDEICPVIPFPTKRPRRGDEVVGEHRDLLFDEFAIEPANILLASEFNPFEAYKQIYMAMDRYKTTLRTMGGCKLFVSPLSSKLLSIGVLLACYDHKYQDPPCADCDVGIPYVETATYGDPDQDGTEDSELHSMWIRGDWEEAMDPPATGASSAGVAAPADGRASDHGDS